MGGATMKVQALGHAVLKVRNLERSEQFYNGVLGIPIAARHETMPMTFFTLGNHHDLAILAVGDDAPDAPRNAPGLYHIALKVGDSLDELREVKQHLEQAGVKIDATIDHTVSQSLYLRDPDGNGVELYIDASDIWKEDPQQVAQGAPLAI
jgi:catechol 2,3-dioxygenase